VLYGAPATVRSPGLIQHGLTREGQISAVSSALIFSATARVTNRFAEMWLLDVSDG
jgi:hypothetical protein